MKTHVKLFIISALSVFLFMILVPSDTKYDTSFFIAVAEENSSYEDEINNDNIKPFSNNISKVI